MIYLASPYSVGKDGSYGKANTGTASKNIRTRRYKEVCKKAAELMKKGYTVFSPIAHSHSIEVHGDSSLKTGDFWLEQDLAILERCDKLIVYKAKGWEASRGIAREIQHAQDKSIPVEYID